jgi:hypothetical protein
MRLELKLEQIDRCKMISRLLEKKPLLVDRGEPVRLPIVNRAGDVVGNLRLLNRKLATNETILADLTEWRRTYMQYFLSRFIPSESRTQSWINDVVFPSVDRLFFLIETQHDSFIGNFALANVNVSCAELDNLIRGRRGGGPDFIYFAECSMLWWLFADRYRDVVTLHVFSNNLKTVLLHKGVGFSKTRSEPLFVHPNGIENGYVLHGSTVDAGFAYDEMAITREEFLYRNPWVQSAFQYVDSESERSRI